jgi:SAM-dependent methyltransferase
MRLRTHTERFLTRLFRRSEEENRAAILRVIRRHEPLERVIDLGCYDGSFTRRLAIAAKARQVAGVELLERHARRANRAGIKAIVADLNEPLPIENDAFDLVHANQVIEHVRKTDLLLKEMVRISRPGGIVIISTNNLSSWHNIVSLLLGFQPMPSHVSDLTHVGNPFNFRRGRPHEDEGQMHLRIFTRRALAELAALHGLDTLSLDASGYYPLPPTLARVFSRVDKTHAAFIIGVFRSP